MGLLSKSKSKSKSKSSLSRRESHFLKLIHPGGFVELHANPIMASEVMKNNPRHCVTRPDFFQYPWIVVSPESILTPGNVFYIVPCHTIRHFFKLRSRNMYSPDQDQDHHRHCFQKPSSLSTSSCVRHKQRKGGNWVQSPVRVVYYSSTDYNTSRQLPSVGSPSSRFGTQHPPKLKPCLKKDNTRSRRNLKVRFACNHHDHHQSQS